MRLGEQGYPCVLLGHRKREFLETTVESLRENATGITDLVIVDDSGDPEHHDWLDDNNYQFSVVHPLGGQGYLEAMKAVWEIAGTLRENGADHVLLWEEDFVLTEKVDMFELADLLTLDPYLAQVNLQRQAVYKIERRLGYMQSHARRGYGIVTLNTAGIPWVRRRRPFTTNPGMLQGAVFDVAWPTRAEADATRGGAEPAMSKILERKGYHFGWLGLPNHPQTKHVGDLMKTGKGY